MKRFEIRTTLDSQFAHGVVMAGTLVGTLVMDQPVDPVSLLSMIQFHQAKIEAVHSVDHVESTDLSEQKIDTNLDGSGTEESELDDSTDVFVDPVEETESASDLSDFLDESLVESLAANNIKTKDQLLAHVDSGANLVELDKIGPTRAKRIIAAVALMRPSQE